MSNPARSINMSSKTKSNNLGAYKPAPESAVPSPDGADKVKESISYRANKAKRITFFRNGDGYHPGLTIPVSSERYRSFDSICDDLTTMLKKSVQIPGAVRNIYSMNGKKIANIEEFVDGGSYICSCNSERFKKGNYNTFSQLGNKGKSKSLRSSLPVEKGTGCGNGNRAAGDETGSNTACIAARPEVTIDSLSYVQPRIVMLIRNGARPRSIKRLLLNKRNSPSLEHVLEAITNVVHLDTGCVRKVFTLSGRPVKELADFFGDDDTFLVYGNERVDYGKDFVLDMEEENVMAKLYNSVSSKPNRNNTSNILVDGNGIPLHDHDIKESKLPRPIRKRYELGKILGEGGFGIVVKIEDRETRLPYALKIINKLKLKGKKHYLDAELRISKELRHPHIVSLLTHIDYRGNRYFVLEYVSGGDLGDAMNRGMIFSEEQSRLIMRQLASALIYLHSMNIMHRDIKPENLFVELDNSNNIITVKLGDFSFVCEAKAPVFNICGTPQYMAPEIIKGKGYGLKADVWSAGILLYAVLVGIEPFDSSKGKLKSLDDAILAGAYEYPEGIDVSTGAKDLIRKMLECEPESRITSKEVFTHFWITGCSSNCNDSI